jgi:hypothetical protein
MDFSAPKDPVELSQPTWLKPVLVIEQHFHEILQRG